MQNFYLRLPDSLANGLRARAKATGHSMTRLACEGIAIRLMLPEDQAARAMAKAEKEQASYASTEATGPKQAS